MKKNFLPISIDISNQKILVIGGGQSAYKKIKILHRFSADVEVLATVVCNEIKQLGIKYTEANYQKEFLPGYLMLYSCTKNQEVNQQILADGKDLGVLVNIHDEPDLCEFVSPAIYKNGKLTVAVGSNGEDVYESIGTRNRIAEFLNDKYNNN